jgi:hypothetical protein
MVSRMMVHVMVAPEHDSVSLPKRDRDCQRGIQQPESELLIRNS